MIVCLYSDKKEDDVYLRFYVISPHVCDLHDVYLCHLTDSVPSSHRMSAILCTYPISRNAPPSGGDCVPLPAMPCASCLLRTDVSVHHQTFNFLSLLLSLTSRQQSHAQR